MYEVDPVRIAVQYVKKEIQNYSYEGYNNYIYTRIGYIWTSY